MTLQELFNFLIKNRAIIVGLMLSAPWLSWLICVAIPGKQEEPLVLNLNLGLALLSLVGEVGYLLYATNHGGWSRVVSEADILLLLTPLYYVGVSLWVSRQRLPLSQLPAFRVVQGLGMIAAAYLFFSWILSKIRLIFWSYLPLGLFLLLLAAIAGIAYLGYLRLRGYETSSKEFHSDQTQSDYQNNNIEGELERLLRHMRRIKK